MSKFDILTAKEFSKFKIHPEIIRKVEDFSKKIGLKKTNINILDWGCGRGKEVLWLREHGYNAFGTDVNSIPLKNGLLLFESKGYDRNLLSLLNSQGKAKFPNNFFHFSFSNQVFEHISNLDKVAEELFRITKKNGAGFHILPAHKYIVEGHLYMPFVHWLPKNKLRKFLIAVYVFLGIEPHWTGLKNKKEKINKYYHYSINNTHYRSFSKIKSIFEHKGFLVEIKTLDRLKISQNIILSKLIKVRLLYQLANLFLRNFIKIDLYIIKK